MDTNGPAGPGGTPPGPAGAPLFGHTATFASDPLAFFERCRDEVGSDVVAVDITGDRGYVLTHPDHVERVLVTDAPDFGKGTVARESLGVGLPDSLFVTAGDRWRRDRTLLQPPFARESLAAHAEDVTAVAREAVANWAHGEPVDLLPAMQRLTLRVLAKTLLDVDLGDRLSEIREAAAALRRRFDSNRPSAYLPVWTPTPANVRAGLALGDLYDVVGGLVDERRRELGDPHGGNLEATDREDLLTLLLTASYPDGEHPDPATIRDQLVTFLVAGHETTALTLTYACYLLATHPDEQARLREELDRDWSGIPTAAADADSLPFLDAVVSEALRLYPPAPVLFREPERDVCIDGYEIPAGSVLALPQWAIHRDERWWADPQGFRPARFQGETARPEYAFFPFGAGPRHCIGMRFARREAKLALATILSRYRLEPATTPPLSVRMALTLQPEGPVRVVPREG